MYSDRIILNFAEPLEFILVHRGDSDKKLFVIVYMYPHTYTALLLGKKN